MAETVRVEKQSGVSVRAFSRGEESALLDILKDAFGSFADVPRTRAAYPHDDSTLTDASLPKRMKHQSDGWQQLVFPETTGL